LYIQLWFSCDVSPRPYKSSRRDATATQTRERIVRAATTILGGADAIREFSLEGVARKAGVTRLTVYNHFGSRRALLEAAFDDRAACSGFHRIADIMAEPDPRRGLSRVIAFFCDFWNSDPGTFGLLHAASAADPEIEASLRERLERRRKVLTVLVARIGGDRLKSKAAGDLVDVLFALTGYEFFSELAVRGRTAAAACKQIQSLATDAVNRALAG
jgi:AcrR family transcriptional regulator